MGYVELGGVLWRVEPLRSTIAKTDQKVASIPCWSLLDFTTPVTILVKVFIVMITIVLIIVTVIMVMRETCAA